MGSRRRETARRPTERGGVPDPVILDLRYRPERGPDGITGDDDSQDITRAELALQLNASIFKAGQSLADREDDDFELTFLCACGCMAEVKRSLQDYVIRGAVIAGHARPAGQLDF
jgi:hypothetical protein